MLDQISIALVQDSFQRLSEQRNAFANHFYTRLFALDPSLRGMFPQDLQAQEAKLMATLQVAVGGLRDLERILPTLRHLGRNHAGYGVSDEHYRLVGQALLDTLRLELGPDCTPEVSAAWAATYAILSGVMRSAATLAAAERRISRPLRRAS